MAIEVPLGEGQTINLPTAVNCTQCRWFSKGEYREFCSHPQTKQLILPNAKSFCCEKFELKENGLDVIFDYLEKQK